MPGTTPNFLLPYPLLSSDPPNGAQQIQDLATTLDTVLTTATSTTYSQVLTGADLRVTQGTRTTVLTVTFSLTRAQAVWVGAKARIVPDGTSGNVGVVGLMIVVDGSTPALGEVGPVSVDVPGNITRGHLAIPAFPVALAAGSHTIALVADRDANGVLNATADSTVISGHTYNPTSLTVIT